MWYVQESQALFEKAVKAKPDAQEASETLETVNNVLGQFEGKGIQCVEAQ